MRSEEEDVPGRAHTTTPSQAAAEEHPAADAPLGSRTVVSTSRLEAFSDGVFAVAITLLIFGIAAPRSRPGELGNGLLAQWPSYVAYATSFLTIGIIWVNHHATFSRIRAADRPLMFVNLLLLMTVCFIPFPTNLLGAYLPAHGLNAKLAAALYGATMTAMSLCFWALWAYAVYGGLVDPKKMDRRSARASVPRFGLGVIIYAATIGIAFLSPELDLAIFGLLALYYVFDQQMA